MKVKRIFILAKKNLFDLLKDPKVLLLGFIAPLILVFLMGFLFNFEIRFDKEYTIGYQIDESVQFDIEKLNPYGLFNFNNVIISDQLTMEEICKNDNYLAFLTINKTADVIVVAFYKNVKNNLLTNVFSGMIRAAVEKENIILLYSARMREYGISDSVIHEVRHIAKNEGDIVFEDGIVAKL